MGGRPRIKLGFRGFGADFSCLDSGSIMGMALDLQGGLKEEFLSILLSTCLTAAEAEGGLGGERKLLMCGVMRDVM